MALSGSTSTNISAHTKLVFVWTAVQSVSAWHSTISWELQLQTDSVGNIQATSESPNTVTIDGQTFADAANIGIGTNETKTLESGQITLEHDAEGNRSFEYSFSQVCNITIMDVGYVGTVTGSGVGELDKLSTGTEEPETPEEPDTSAILQRKRTFVYFYLLGRCCRFHAIGGES